MGSRADHEGGRARPRHRDARAARSDYCHVTLTPCTDFGNNDAGLFMKGLLLLILILSCSFAAHAQSTPSPTATPTSTSVTTSPKSPETVKSPPAKSAVMLPPEKAQPVRIARFNQPPVIDGKLDDTVWKQAAVLKDFYQIQPGENLPPSKPTEVMIGYDAKFLYVAFHAYDEPDKVRANVAKRDAIFDDDYVGFFLDTFNDRRRAFEMNFNPLGIQADGIMTEGMGEDFSLDLVMESKGMVTGDGYTVEVAIPFKSLRYEAGKGKFWGAHFYRRIKRINNELDSWMPVSRDKSGFLNQAGRLTGLEGISTERTLELIPSLTLSETGKRVRSMPRAMTLNNPALSDPGRFVNEPLKFDPGLTGKIGLTPTITLDFAVNPDFAQVEADQTVVTANQRFPIFFQEKRPFFLEGIEIFQTQINAVHTRAIVDPDYAVKLTGKRGRNTFGILLASDNAPGNYSEEERRDPEIRPRIEKFLDKNAYIGILRYKRDVGKESNIGFLATSYNFIEKRNQLGGFDGRFKINPQTFFDFQVLGTTSRNFFRAPDMESSIYRTGNGLAYSYSYDVSKRHFGYQLSGSGRTRDYRADVGFTRRTNTNNKEFFVRWNTEPNPKATLISFRLGNFVTTNFDWQRRMQEWFQGTNFNFQFKHQMFMRIGTNFGYERLFEEEFGARRTATRSGAFFGSDPERSTYIKTIFAVAEKTFSKKYSGVIFVGTRRGQFDLDFGAGRRFPRVSPAALRDPNAPLDPGPGNSLDANISFTYQPTASLRASLNYTKARLSRRDTGRVAFDDNIFSLRTTYQFTRFTFARARIDYDTLASNARAQFLLGWTPNPGTSFYVGYNDDVSRNGFNPFTGQLEPGFRRNGRTFFVKMSYLFRRSF